MSISVSTTNTTIIAGNYGYILNFTILNSDNTPANLIGYTVTFRVGEGSTMLFNKPCTVTNPAQGLVQYTVASTDFPNSGFFYAAIELTQAGILEDTLPFVLNVIPAVP